MNRRQTAATTLAELERQADLLDTERSHLAATLRDLPQSRDLWWGLIVLGLFAASGVVMPIIMIALVGDDGPLSARFKFAVVLGFIAGLIALGVYLTVQVGAIFTNDTKGNGKRSPAWRRRS